MNDVANRTPTIGILSAISDVEHPALLVAFGLAPGTPPHDQQDQERYWFADVARTDGQPLKAVISCIAGSGNTEPQIPVERMIRRFAPEAMFFVGIACGLRSYQLGDVVTSEVIWGYEYVKTQSSGNLDRSRAKVSPQHLTNDVAFFAQHNDWGVQFASVLAKFPKEQRPRNMVNPSIRPSVWIASGEKVMTNGELAKLNQTHDKIRAGEMEGYGFAIACESQRPATPWLVIRGISDYGDATKDGKSAPSNGDTRSSEPPSAAPNKDEFHLAAAVAAATYLRSFLGTAYTMATRANRALPSEREPIVPGTLNDRQIATMAGNGLLIAEEFDQRQIAQACYELRVGDIYYELGDEKRRLDASRYGYVLLKPRQLTVVITKESLDIPHDVVGRILSKGRLFSVGILPVNTYADPGFQGRLGIVLYNVTDRHLRLRVGESVAKIEFSRLIAPVERPYFGQHGYQTQIWPIPEDVVMTDAELLRDDRFAVRREVAGTVSQPTPQTSGLVRAQRIAMVALVVSVVTFLFTLLLVLTR